MRSWRDGIFIIRTLQLLLINSQDTRLASWLKVWKLRRITLVKREITLVRLWCLTIKLTYSENSVQLLAAACSVLDKKTLELAHIGDSCRYLNDVMAVDIPNALVHFITKSLFLITLRTSSQNTRRWATLWNLQVRPPIFRQRSLISANKQSRL